MTKIKGCWIDPHLFQATSAMAARCLTVVHPVFTRRMKPGGRATF
jgi:hypothetical protein